ncbi:MAG: glycosyltransferase family 2 protein [Bernardetiaceae bacterium]
MQVSFIVPYRDRAPKAVFRCLSSLLAQHTEINYQICFIDYGSQEENRQSVADWITQNDPQKRISYAYADTRGWLWCKSHANNLALDMTTGDYVIAVDVDLIYPPFFLEKVKDFVASRCHFFYYCYMAPQDFKGYERINWQEPLSFRLSNPSPIDTGLMGAPKTAFTSAGGFDEYYRIWGVEDGDMNLAIQHLDYKQVVLPLNEGYAVHQWHPSNAQIDTMPRGWYEVMKKKKTNPRRFRPLLAQITEMRSAKHLFENGDVDKLAKFVFSIPIQQSYTLFFAAFERLTSGEAMLVAQDFDWIDTNPDSRLSGIFKKINRWLDQTPLSYRWVELLTYQQEEVLDFYAVRDFLYYFLLNFDTRIQDYYLNVQARQNISFLIIKK